MLATAQDHVLITNMIQEIVTVITPGVVCCNNKAVVHLLTKWTEQTLPQALLTKHHLMRDL